MYTILENCVTDEEKSVTEEQEGEQVAEVDDEHEDQAHKGSI